MTRGNRSAANSGETGNPTIVRRFLPATIFLAYFAYALIQSAPHLTGGGTGEYVAAGAYLGNVHPPGNPVHHMLSYLLQQLPFGDAYGRTVALSCIASAGSLAFLCAMLLAAGCGPLAAAGTSVLFGFSPVVTSGALVVKGYALLLLFGAAFSLWFLRTEEGEPRSGLSFPSLLAGLGAGVHYLSVCYTVPMLAIRWRRGGDRGRSLLQAAGLFLCGFAVMLYLPARSLAGPPIDYGHPSTLASFFRSLTWQTYAPLSGHERTVSLLMAQLFWTLEALFRSLSPLVLPAAAIGGIVCRGKSRPVNALLAAGGIFLAANYVLHNDPSRERTLVEMPRFIGLSALPLYFLAGIGIDRLLAFLRPGLATERWKGFLAWSSALAFSSVCLVTGWKTAILQSRSGDLVVRDFYREAFLSLPPNAAIFLNDDTGVFSALALHFVERLRPDVLPIDQTEHYLASIYEPESPATPAPVKVRRAEREALFVRTYEGAVAFVNLPEWTRYAGRTRSYGRIHLADAAIPPPGAYFLPPDGPIRFDPAAAPAYDRKTREFLLWILYRDFLRGSPSLAEFERSLSGIAPLAWDQAPFFINYGAVLMEAGRLDDAERVLRRGLAIDPSNFEGKKQLGFLLARTKRLEEAVPMLSDHNLEDVPEGMFYIGNYHLLRGSLAEAIGRYRSATSLGYRTAPLYNNLGVALLRTNDPVTARRMFEEALRIDPAYQGARDNIFRLDAGQNTNRERKR